MKFVLTSTVVSPFTSCQVLVVALDAYAFKTLTALVTQNFCGHPVTLQKLQEAGIVTPEAQKGQFWDMKGVALAARPKGGVRGAVEAEIEALDELEFCAYVILDKRSKYDVMSFGALLGDIIYSDNPSECSGAHSAELIDEYAFI